MKKIRVSCMLVLLFLLPLTTLLFIEIYPTSNVNWIDFFHSVVLSIFLAYIAFLQMKTNERQVEINNNKLKLDLYNKRIEIYDNTIKFYQELVLENNLTSEVHFKFIRSKEASKFLFSKSPEIHALLEQMHDQSFNITSLKQTGSSLAQSSPEQFIQKSNDAAEARKFFNNNIENLSKLMNPYMSMP